MPNISTQILNNLQRARDNNKGKDFNMQFPTIYGSSRKKNTGLKTHFRPKEPYRYKSRWNIPPNYSRKYVLLYYIFLNIFI